MMKTFAPKKLHSGQLHELLSMLQWSNKDAAKFLHVTERSVYRWLSENSAPYMVLALLWHESPEGRDDCAIDHGNELQIMRSLARSTAEERDIDLQRLAYLLKIGDFGAANDPLMNFPFVPGLMSDQYSAILSDRTAVFIPASTVATGKSIDSASAM